MAENFDEFGFWPGRGDWRGRAEHVAEWDGATPWEKKFARDIATEHELTRKRRPALPSVPLIPTCSIAYALRAAAFGLSSRCHTPIFFITPVTESKR